VVFFFYDLLIVVLALAIDCKLHWIVCQLASIPEKCSTLSLYIVNDYVKYTRALTFANLCQIPVREDHELEKDVSLRSSVISLLGGATQGLIKFWRPNALRRARRRTTFVALSDARYIHACILLLRCQVYIPINSSLRDSGGASAIPVSIYLCMYHTYVCMYVCMCMYVYTHTHTHIDRSIYRSIYIYISTCAYIYVYA
jgi:hypothetical protein